jgi:hypothetical protein
MLQYTLWSRTGRSHISHRPLWSWSRWGPEETDRIHGGCLEVDSRIPISPRQDVQINKPSTSIGVSAMRSPPFVYLVRQWPRIDVWFCSCAPSIWRGAQEYRTVQSKANNEIEKWWHFADKCPADKLAHDVQWYNQNQSHRSLRSGPQVGSKSVRQRPLEAYQYLPKSARGHGGSWIVHGKSKLFAEVNTICWSLLEWDYGQEEFVILIQLVQLIELELLPHSMHVLKFLRSIGSATIYDRTYCPDDHPIVPVIGILSIWSPWNEKKNKQRNNQ